MKKWAMIFATIATLFLFASCGDENYEINEEILNEIEEIPEPEEVEQPQEILRAENIILDLQYAMGTAQTRREGIIKPDYNMLLSMTKGRTPTPRIPQRFWYGWGGPPESPPEFVTLDDAVADAWVLFNVLRDVYGGYVFFGGDGVFAATLGDVTAELFALGVTEILAVDYADILRRHLTYNVVDNHFWIGGERMGSEIAYFHRLGLFYDKTADGFINRATGLYLLEIEGHDIDTVMHLHTSVDGDLFYRPIFLISGTWANTYRTNFIYEGDIISPRTFVRESEQQSRPAQMPRFGHAGNVPIVTVAAMGFDGHENAWGVEHAVTFISFAEQLRYEPVVIVDIRGNIGGNSLLPVRWLHTLTGEIVPSNFVSLNTQEYDPALFEFNPNNQFQNPPDTWSYFRAFEPFGDGYTLSHNEPRRIVQREQTLILLTDRGTLSAAEAFVDMAFNITNTLVIGTATAGMLAFDATYSNLFLPNTGIAFGLGRTMMLWPEGHFAEGVGIQPDIWVDGDAMAAALALISDLE
ncbi:MAG: S41 family peptidase [Defluviitaleaceae bacterium]|nr:S41 family peptidase [Defluviitaleaceae bacterium]